jgi:hypothetical protein
VPAAKLRRYHIQKHEKRPTACAAGRFLFLEILRGVGLDFPFSDPMMTILFFVGNEYFGMMRFL